MLLDAVLHIYFYTNCVFRTQSAHASPSSVSCAVLILHIVVTLDLDQGRDETHNYKAYRHNGSVLGIKKIRNLATSNIKMTSILYERYNTLQ